MANVPITAGSGTNIATNSVTRDSVTEQMELVNLADSTTAITASVTAAGTAGTNGIIVQGHASGVPQPVSGTVTANQGTAAVVANAWPIKSVNDATTTTLFPATATLVVVKASAGRLVQALVTAVGTTNLTIFDNASAASGTIIGIIPSTATVGQVFVWAVPAANGITAQCATTTPATTVGWA